jgi:adenylate kinase
MQENGPRSSPVIVITGTPGTGKTTHAQLLVEQSPVPLQHINVSELVKEKMLHDGFDEEWQTYVVDEDKVRPLLYYPLGAPGTRK